MAAVSKSLEPIPSTAREEPEIDHVSRVQLALNTLEVQVEDLFKDLSKLTEGEAKSKEPSNKPIQDASFAVTWSTLPYRLSEISTKLAIFRDDLLTLIYGG